MKEKTLETPLIKEDFISKDAYSRLITNIKYSSLDNDIKTILITSAKSGDCKSTIVANLAVNYQSLGKNVLILDLDLRRPTIHKIFKAENLKGINDFVADKDMRLEDIITKTSLGVDIISPGKPTQLVEMVLSSNRLNEALDKLKDMYDIIVIDSSPCVEISDPLIFVKQVDGVILVCKENVTKKNDLKQAVEGIKFAQGNLLGIVFSNISYKKSKNYYGYGK